MDGNWYCLVAPDILDYVRCERMDAVKLASRVLDGVGENGRSWYVCARNAPAQTRAILRCGVLRAKARGMPLRFFGFWSSIAL